MKFSASPGGTSNALIRTTASAMIPPIRHRSVSGSTLCGDLKALVPRIQGFFRCAALAVAARLGSCWPGACLRDPGRPPTQRGRYPMSIRTDIDGPPVLTSPWPDPAVPDISLPEFLLATDGRRLSWTATRGIHGVTVHDDGRYPAHPGALVRA